LNIKLITRKAFLVAFCLVLSFVIEAQVVTTSPLGSNKVIKTYLEEHPGYVWNNPQLKNKWGVKDTLSLPFFDDFATSSLYPDSSRWLNNQVYVNNHFPVEPPTLNVATFDVMDEYGIPYNNTINKDFKSSGDSLISQPINLLDSGGTAYTLADSIMLSFFFQPNGYGYHLNGEDSIRLFFKADNNSWLQVWSKGGSETSKPFEHVIVPILNPYFLHEDFQFMFTTYTRQVGNANHWHIDYVYLDKGRSVSENTYNDYAIQSTPSSLLVDYFEMPYDHFMVSPGSHMPDSIFTWASNLSDATKNIEIRHEADFLGTPLVNTVFSANANNIENQSNAERRLKSYPLTGLVGDMPIVINRKVEIRENGVPNEYTDNDFIELKQTFYDCYAYDDGSAERGFGFDHNTNPSNIPGEIALAFNIAKEDTLYAISTFFNEAVYDVSNRRFTFRIWSSLEGIKGGTQDSIIYESEELTPEYNIANERRSFSAHYIDTLLILQPGTYYLGWHQKSMFNLDIGWDMNHGNQRNPNKASPHLYYKVFGVWGNDELPNGTLMMRPRLGSSRPLHVGVKEIKSIDEVRLYPNPASGTVFFGAEYAHAELFNLHGEILKIDHEVSQLSLEGIRDGVYFVKLTNEEGHSITSKLVIFAN
jgi:hypothetical protein